MNKLVVCIMGQDCKDFLEIALKSVEDADAIVFCDGGSRPEFMTWLKNQNFQEPFIIDHEHHGKGLINGLGKIVIQQEFKQDDPLMNGKQRRFYLDFLKEHYKGWYCLALDADEFVQDIQSFKDFINNPSITAPAYGTRVNEDTKEEETIPIRRLYCPRMRHLVYSLIQEDSTEERHWAPHRLFEITDDIQYPLGEHNVILTSTMDVQTAKVKDLLVWHLAYAPMFHIKRRYDRNLRMSEVHDKLYLKQWNQAHLFGQYPTSVFNPEELPRFFLEHFGINYDEIYFKNRRELEVKHFIDGCNWKGFFGITLGNEVLEIGCGVGPRIAAMRYMGIEAIGIEISQWAVDNAIVKNTALQGDITVPYPEHITPLKYKLVVAYDVLEHVRYEKLDQAIDKLLSHAQKYLLISVPTIGDPNLEKDPTHIIKETKEWWRQQFLQRGCKEIPVPSYFLYPEQQLIFEVPQ